MPYRNFSDEDLLGRLQRYASESDYELFEERRGRLWHIGFYAGGPNKPMSVERMGATGRTHRQAAENLVAAVEGVHGPRRPVVQLALTRLQAPTL
jgi:hypothetical protein